MEIENSPIWTEVQTVIGSANTTSHYVYTATIHANGLDYPVFRVLEINNRRDYESQHADETIIKVMVPKGTYYAYIYPYMDALEMTVYKTPLGEVSETTTGGTVETERYVATIANKDSGGNPLMQQNGANVATIKTLNLTDMNPIEFQLVNKAIAQMRMAQAGQIFRGTTTDAACRAILTKASQDAVSNSPRTIQGVSIVKGHNQTVRDHIVIPQGISTLDIPQYIHERCGGVYTSGFGYYLQGSSWYVYPSYDPTRANTGGPSLTILNIPEIKLPSIERSFRVTGNNIVILGNGQTKFSDQTNHDQLNQGNGVRFTDAGNFIDKIVTATGNKALMMRNTLNTEVVNVKRTNGYQNAKRSSTPINANPYQEYSQLAKRSGSVVGITWQYSDPSLITPGMPCTILYMNGDDVCTLNGVVLKSEHHTRTVGSGANNSRHVTDTGLSIFTARPVGSGAVSNTNTIQYPSVGSIGTAISDLSGDLSGLF
jgi:hypothetical protein